jgi:thiol:disulfide interchange protein
MTRMTLKAAALSTLTVLTLGGDCRAQAVSAPPSADAVVAAALKSAQAGNEVVLIECGASWCSWCRKFDAFVHAPEVGQIVASQYVVANLTVHEGDGKKALENAGGEVKMNAWGGEKSGLPFYVFLDAAGRKVADSNAMPDRSNIGFPGTPQEVQMFVALIDRTAPKLSSADRSKIVDYLNKTLKP